jgi:hypothetical protein
MAEKQTYKVLRRLDGSDRAYEIGDTREMTAADAKHLVELGALEPVSGKAAKAPPAEETKEEPVEWEHHEIAKAEEAPLNKAEEPAPVTKTTRAMRK